MIYEGICIGGSLEGQERVYASPSFYSPSFYEDKFEAPQYVERDMDKPLDYFTERYDWVCLADPEDPTLGVWVYEYMPKHDLLRTILEQFRLMAIERNELKHKAMRFRTGR